MPEPATLFIYHLASAPAAGLTQRPRNVHPFLPQIESAFTAHETPAGDAVYRIFEQDFLLSPEKSEAKIRGAYGDCTALWIKIVQRNEYIPPEGISKKLRGSSTLRLDESNSFATGGGNLVVFSPQGISISRKEEGAWGATAFERDAEKTIECYLLALAYQRRTEYLLQRAIAAFDNGQAQEMIDARDALCAFDLKYFFANPVRMEVFETRALWDMAARHCGVKSSHDEIKIQILELATIIENRRRDAEEVRQRRMERNLTIIGLFLSALSLLELLKGFWN